jgi:Rieske Fe-S protein
VGGGKVYPDVPVIVTQPSAGEFRGFGIVCTHDGCELNSVSDGTINCPCHGSRFAITDGSLVQGPARTGLRQEAIAVDGGCIVLL